MKSYVGSHITRNGWVGASWTRWRSPVPIWLDGWREPVESVCKYERGKGENGLGEKGMELREARKQVTDRESEEGRNTIRFVRGGKTNTKGLSKMEKGIFP